MSPRASGEKPPVRRAPNTSLVEWMVAIASAVLVAGVVGFLIYDGLKSPQAPPAVTIEVESIHAAGPGYMVLFRARNDGHRTAADVVVEGELEADSSRVEASQTVLEYVAPGGVERGGLYFERDPRQARLKLRAHGYRDP